MTFCSDCAVLHQASGFRNQLNEMLFISEIHKDLVLAITWGSADLFNVGVTDVRNNKSEIAEFFSSVYQAI